ncbi:MAG: hypothetical protein H6Q70_2009 [Firmicutes bacterium]|nr:hypothetical protein [Bacillota bacterium]
MDKTVFSTKDGRYQITVTDTAVFLSVWSPLNGGTPVSKTAIIQDLKKRNLMEFDENFISTVIREAMGTPSLIMNCLPKKDGRYQITITDTAVFLSVWPPTNGGKPVLKSTIIQELTEKKLTDFDQNFVFSVIKEASGRPALIMNSIVIEPMRNINVKVRLNRLEAMIDISIAEDAPTATVPELLNKLKEAGVVYGIDMCILATLTQTRFAKDVACAYGIEPRNGEKAYLKYYFDADSQGRPEEQEDGRVDFKETNNFLCVEEAKLLVEKIPATPGVSGIDVFGKEILPKPGKDIPMPVGKNVICVDNWRLYAAIDGHLHVFLDKRINVIPIIVIDGDVDYATGNIDFKGSVIVRGSVQTDFCVKAGGNVEVCGNICGGTVEANNIIVRKGIQGMNRGFIKARERLVSGFIENATVYADTDVVVSDFIMNSNVFAGSRVIIEGRRGLVRGGRISAGEVIRAVTVGNKSGVVTELEVSINPFLKDELLNLRSQIQKDETLYKELEQSISYIRKQGIERLSAIKQERYKKDEAEFQLLPERIEEVRQRIANIENLLRSLKPGRIRVSDFIYPGTKMSIGPSAKILKDALKYVLLYNHQGEIKFSSLH